jgi:hypothetical protein
MYNLVSFVYLRERKAPLFRAILGADVAFEFPSDPRLSETLKEKGF